MATCSRTLTTVSQAPLTGSDTKPAPEEEVKPRGPLAVAAGGLAEPGKRLRPRVPLTKQEEEKLLEVTAQHSLGRKELLTRLDRRDKLRKGCDELMFKRRCWAAIMANQVFTLRTDIAHVRHQLRIDWKKGDPIPDELVKARRCMNSAFVVSDHIGRAMDMGLEAFLEDYRKFYDNEKVVEP